MWIWGPRNYWPRREAAGASSCVGAGAGAWRCTFSASGVLVFTVLCSRPFRTNCAIVGNLTSNSR